MKFDEIQIIRSNRKSLSLEVLEDGRVQMRAPKLASERSLRRFFREKESWLARSVEKQKRQFAKRPQRTFTSGETFFYLGKPHELVIRSERGVRGRPLEVHDAFYLCPTAEHRAEAVIKRWYKSRAKFVFHDRAEFFAPLMNVEFDSIRLSSAKTRWGSCGSKNTLNFNWRLIMAPMEVIDSVIVHELAHCRYKHHGKRFWQFVATHCPTYDQHDRWLKSNAPRLFWD